MNRIWHDLLLVRFVLYNLLGVMGVIAAYLLGIVEQVYEADTSRISWLIVALFLYGWGVSWVRVAKVSHELNDIHDGTFGEWSREYLETGSDDSLRHRLTAKMEAVEWVVWVLPRLGMVGTLWGFILAISTLDLAQLGNVQAVGPSVGTMLEGVGIAIYTTLVGLVGSIWLMGCLRLLNVGLDRIYVKLIECGNEKD